MFGFGDSKCLKENLHHKPQAWSLKDMDLPRREEQTKLNSTMENVGSSASILTILFSIHPNICKCDTKLLEYPF